MSREIEDAYWAEFEANLKVEEERLARLKAQAAGPHSYGEIRYPTDDTGDIIP